MNIVLFYVVLFSGFFSNDPPKLTLNMTHIETLRGEIIIGVFNADKTFLKEGAAVKTYIVEVGEREETLVIEDLPDGDYAISLYHDENSDRVCNRNFLGIPKEGYGFSNNIKPKLSAPSYKDCKFMLTKETELTIDLIQ